MTQDFHVYFYSTLALHVYVVVYICVFGMILNLFYQLVYFMYGHIPFILYSCC